MAVFIGPLAANAQVNLKGEFSALPDKHTLASDPLRSRVEENWDTEWVPVSRHDYYYNSAGRISNIFRLAWDTTLHDFAVSHNSIREYNEDGRTTERFELDYDPAMDTLVYSFRMTTEWEDDLILSQFSYNWDGMQWAPSSAVFSTIEEGVVTRSLSQRYDRDRGMLVNSVLRLSEYDNLGRDILSVFNSWVDETSEWRTISRNSTQYGDLYSIQTTESYQADSTWKLVSKTTNTFNEQMQTITRIDTLYNGEVPQTFALRYYYNELGIISELLHQIQDPDTGDFKDNRRTLYTSDEDGAILEVVYQIQDGGAWLNDHRSTYTYLPALVSNENEKPLSTATLDVYPSPSRGPVNLDIQLDQPSALHVEVYDLLGRRVTTLAKASTATGTQHLVWEPKEAAAGLYFLRIQLDESVETRAVTLIR